MSRRVLIIVACLMALPLFGEAAEKKKMKKMSGAHHQRVWNDTTRLAAILNDAQIQGVTFTADAWRVTANEANMLANRIYAGARGRSQARELRTHVRQMRAAALKGDAVGARSHASEALPFAYQLIDWSMPSNM